MLFKGTFEQTTLFYHRSSLNQIKALAFRVRAASMWRTSFLRPPILLVLLAPCKHCYQSLALLSQHSHFVYFWQALPPASCRFLTPVLTLSASGKLCFCPLSRLNSVDLQSVCGNIDLRGGGRGFRACTRALAQGVQPAAATAGTAQRAERGDRHDPHDRMVGKGLACCRQQLG
eukprot:362547-Chlamydomonas_euryale.AAC.3